MHIAPFDNQNKPIVDIDHPLVPLNYFSGKVAALQYDLETAASNVEVLLNRTRRRQQVEEEA